MNKKCGTDVEARSTVEQLRDRRAATVLDSAQVVWAEAILEAVAEHPAAKTVRDTLT